MRYEPGWIGCTAAGEGPNEWRSLVLRGAVHVGARGGRPGARKDKSCSRESE